MPAIRSACNIFGGSSVGGKPYVIFAITLLTAVLLAGLRVPPSELKTAIRLSILGGLNFTVSLVGRFVPTVAYWTGAGYAPTSTDDYANIGKQVDQDAATRESFLLIFGRNLSLWISAFKSPLKACFHPLWGPLVLLAVAAATLSGFRSGIAMVALTFFVGFCYRGGFVQIMISATAGIMALALLAIVNATAPLPLTSNGRCHSFPEPGNNAMSPMRRARRNGALKFGARCCSPTAGSRTNGWGTASASPLVNSNIRQV